MYVLVNKYMMEAHLGLSASQTVGTAVRAVLHATMQTMLEPWEHSDLHLLRRDGNNLLSISAISVSPMCSKSRETLRKMGPTLSHGLDHLLTGNKAWKQTAFVPPQAMFWRVLLALGSHLHLAVSYSERSVLWRLASAAPYKMCARQAGQKQSWMKFICLWWL